MVTSTSVPVLTPDRLGLELGGDLVEQRLVQVLSDQGFAEPNEGGALRRGFIYREPAIALEGRAIVQGFGELHVRKIVPHGKQHRFEQGQWRPCRLALRRAGDACQSPINRSPVAPQNSQSGGSRRSAVWVIGSSVFRRPAVAFQGRRNRIGGGVRLEADRLGQEVGVLAQPIARAFDLDDDGVVKEF